MNNNRNKVKAVLMMAFAVLCVSLALLWPSWRNELRAQGDTLFSPSLTIDICEVDQAGGVTIGGKDGENTRVGEPVFVSRGSKNQSVGVVLSDGTFEGSTAPDFAAFGQKVTVEINHISGTGDWLMTCELEGIGGRSRP